MLRPRFGSKAEPLEGLLELAKQINGKLSGFALDAVLKEHYETTYGIVDINDPQRPLALVGESDVDGNYYMSSLYNKIRRFKMYEVPKHYGISLTEFFNMPRDITEFILDDLREDETRRHEAKVKAEADAKRAIALRKGGVTGDPSVYIPPEHQM